MQCNIQWVDKQGNSTPDTNPAVGFVYVKAYTSAKMYKGLGYRIMGYAESEKFPICRHHLKEFFDSNLENHHWVFIPLLPDIETAE
jgi:hypothetical protein